jgi:hypothetical protein
LKKEGALSKMKTEMKLPLKLNLQMFAEGQPKTKIEKHLEELGEGTTGGAHDSVTFAGKGLALLKGLFTSSKKLEKSDEDDDDSDDDDDDLEERKTKKNAKINGGDLEEEDEDSEEPSSGSNSIIANKGQRIPKDSLQTAVSKNGRVFDERRFAKSMEEYAEVYDGSAALSDLAETIRTLGKSMRGTNESIAEVKEQNVILAKALREVLKSNAALASDIELIKSQPATNPASGFVVLNKQEGNGQSRRLSKSDIQDTLTDLVNDGVLESKHLANLGRARTDAELNKFVQDLPAAARERL